MIYLQITGDISFQKGLFLFVAALPISITAIANGVWQGRGASAAMQILAKKPEHTTKGIIFVAMMETYAILGFVISFLLVMM